MLENSELKFLQAFFVISITMPNALSTTKQVVYQYDRNVCVEILLNTSV